MTGIYIGVAAILAVGVALVVRRLRGRRAARTHESMKTALSFYAHQNIAPDDVTIGMFRNHQGEARDMIVQLVREDPSASGKVLREMFVSIGLLDICVRDLKSPNWRFRARAVSDLGLLRCGGSGNELRALLEDPVPEVREAATQALATVFPTVEPRPIKPATAQLPAPPAAAPPGEKTTRSLEGRRRTTQITERKDPVTDTGHWSEPLDLGVLDWVEDGGIEGEGAGGAMTLQGLFVHPIPASRMDEVMDSLGATPFFASMNSSTRLRLGPLLRMAEIGPEQTVLKEGDISEGLFLILSGVFECSLQEQDGFRRKVGEFGPGDCFGELSLLTGEPAVTAVVARNGGEVVIVPRHRLAAVSDILPWFGVTLARVIALRLASASASIVTHLKEGLSGRIEQISASALVQGIVANSHSGRLNAWSGNKTFSAEFRDGQVLICEAGAARDEEAFYSFLEWGHGSFRFEPSGGTSVTPARVRSDTRALLLEGVRRLDETRRLSEGILLDDGLDPALQPAAPTELKAFPAFSLSETDEALRALGQVPLFRGLPQDQLRSLLPSLQEVRGLAGDAIIRQGQEGRALYIVASGSFDVTREEGRDKREHLAVLVPGDCFGEMALITGASVSATVSVREEGSLIYLPKQEFLVTLGRAPGVGASLARILASRLVRTSRKLQTGAEALSGRLESLPIAELVQALHVNRQSGTLVVQREGRMIEAVFEEGQIADARAPGRHGEEAFFELLGWTMGSFQLYPERRLTGTRRVTADTMGLLFRGMRRLESASSPEPSPPATA